MSSETTDSIPENLKHALDMVHQTKKLSAQDISQIVSGLSGNFAMDPMVPIMIACSEDAEEGAVDSFLASFAGQAATNMKNVATLFEQGGFARFGSEEDQRIQEERRAKKGLLKQLRDTDDASGEAPLLQKQKPAQ